MSKDGMRPEWSQPALHLRKPETRLALRIQHRVCDVIRAELTRMGFVEFLAPIVGPVTDPGIRGAKQGVVDYYGRDYRVMSSGILYKQLALNAFDKIFFNAPNLRMEPPETAATGRHLAEFYQIDLEMANADYNEAMDVAERITAAATDSVAREFGPELQERGRVLKPLKHPFPRLSHAECVKRLHDAGREQDPRAEIRSQGRHPAVGGFRHRRRTPHALPHRTGRRLEGSPVAQGAGVSMPVDAAGLEPWEAESRRRAKEGLLALFPLRDVSEYGHRTFGQRTERAARSGLTWDQIALAPPLFTPKRFERMLELGREPYFSDVDLSTIVGGFASPVPFYLSAMGGTSAASHGGSPLAGTAARRGVPLVLGENIATVRGYDKRAHPGHPAFKERVEAYASELPETVGGLVIQQSVEDADSELWNRVYSDPDLEPLLATGRLGFELKCGQGAKPGLGGLTLVGATDARRLKAKFLVEERDLGHGHRMRHSAPGTYTEEILRNQVRLMRNNYPRAKIWVKLPPTRDVDAAASTAWEAGADAVTVDGAEGGTGLAPSALLEHVGLPLLECLLLVGRPDAKKCLHVSGGFHEGARIVKAVCLGARAVGLGRAALAAHDADESRGLDRFLELLDLELRMLVSSLGKYRLADLSAEDLFMSRGTVPSF